MDIQKFLNSALTCIFFFSSGQKMVAAENTSAGDAVMQPYGAGTHWNEAKYFAAAKEAGIQWLRIDISWYHVEPEPGVWKWDSVDAALDEAKRLNLRVLAVLGYTPSWAASGEGSESRYRAALAKYDKDFQNYVAQVSKRYAKLVDVWEVWNEPDGDSFLKVEPGSWAAEQHSNASKVEQRRLQYLHNMELALEVMRPLNLKIGTSGFALGGHCDPNFVESLLKRDSWMNQFPIFNFHMYGYPSHEPLLRTIARVKAWQNEMRYETPLWMTEHGITALDVPDDQVRSYLLKSYALALSNGVQKLFWFKLMPGGEHMTMFNEAGSQEAAYAAYKALTTHWNDIVDVHPWEKNDQGVEGAIATRSDGKKVAIVWSKEPLLAASVRSDVGQAYGNAGESISLEGLQVGKNPIFLYLQ